MKIQSYFKILVSFSLLVFLASCSEEFLVEQPQLEQSNEVTLSSYRGLDLATAGSYSLLCDPTWYGVEMIVYGDLKGGLAKRPESTGSGRYIPEYIWNNTPTSTAGYWSTGYYTISRTNNVINAIDDGFEEEGITQDQIDHLKGEALTIRALAYFDLVRIFAQPYSLGRDNPGVPVVLVTENGSPERNTVGEVYDQIVTDLTAAIDLLPESNKRGSDDAWIDVYVAQALLSRVYLYMEDWQGAADMASEVINSGAFELFAAADYQTFDSGGYWGGGGAGSEIILKVDGSEGNSGHGNWLTASYLTNPEGYGDIAASMDLINLYESADIRGKLFTQNLDNPTPTEWWSLKYPGRLGNLREFSVPVIRLAEMYLNRAEATLNGATSDSTAASDITAIRTHRGLGEVSTVTLNQVYDERRRELCFEGHEFFDLKRTQRSLTRTDYSGPDRKNVPYVKGGTPAENYLWAFPIPKFELDANKNMEQNPGY